MATVTEMVLLLTATELIRHGFVTACWLSELPRLSLLPAKSTSGKAATALPWTYRQTLGIGPKKARNTLLS